MFSRTFMIFHLVAYYDTIHLSHSSVGLYVSLFSHSVFIFLVTVFDLFFFLSNSLFRQRDKYWSTVYMLFHSSEIQFFWCSIHKYSYKHVSNKYIKDMWIKDLAEKALSKIMKYSLYVLTISKHFSRNWQVKNWYAFRPTCG